MAYKILVDKNVEIIEQQEYKSETSAAKNIKKPLSDNVQDELLNNILAVMEDKTIILDQKFSIDILAGLVSYNHNYVSEIIHSTFKKNFRSFLNDYRIREAQRLLPDFDDEKYTIESIATLVGFKSKNTFFEAFKNVTGVTPGFYLKSIKKKNS